MKGIILAGGSGTRLRPITLGVNKHLLPVYDKPMIFYPLATLMQAGLRDILFIVNPEDKGTYERMFGDGSQLGLSLSYATQERPEGIAQAFLIAEDFLQGDEAALILGDNIFFGTGMPTLLKAAAHVKKGAVVFAREVMNPQEFGIVDFAEDGRAVSLEEKPKNPRSNWAVTGLYFYDKNVVSVAKHIKPSARGELEITSVNQAYLREGTLQVHSLGAGTAWLDTGNAEALMEAGQMVRSFEMRTGRKIACLDEIAFEEGFITAAQLMDNARGYGKTPYSTYVASRAEEAAESPAMQRDVKIG